MSKKVQLSITLDDDVVEKLKEKAEKDGRTVSGYINYYIKKMLE